MPPCLQRLAAAPRAARQVTGGALFDDYDAPGGAADLLAMSLFVAASEEAAA